jgi:hypothetical protein
LDHSFQQPRKIRLASSSVAKLRSPKSFANQKSIWELTNRSKLERFLDVPADVRSFVPKACHELYTKRAVVEDVEKNVDDGAKLSHS